MWIIKKSQRERKKRRDEEADSVKQSLGELSVNCLILGFCKAIWEEKMFGWVKMHDFKWND